MKTIPKQISVVIMLTIAVMLFSVQGCIYYLQDSRTAVNDDYLNYVSYDELSELVSNADPLVIDVRGNKAFIAGHIPGAINVLVSDITADDERLTTTRPIVVYGAGADDLLPKVAAKKLMTFASNAPIGIGAIEYGDESSKMLGRFAIYTFHGGWREWQDRRKLDSK